MDKFSQQQVDTIFSEMFGLRQPNNIDMPEAIVSLQDHYQHLKSEGYSDEEIQEIFDLALDEERGELNEI